MTNYYELRVGGETRKTYSMISQEVITDFLSFAADNPALRVEVVQVNENTVFSGYEYGQFERHFNRANGTRR